MFEHQKCEGEVDYNKFQQEIGRLIFALRTLVNLGYLCKYA